MIAVIRWTLWQRRWSIVWWSLGVAAFIVISLGFYASFRDQAAQLNQVLDKLPHTARALFTDANNFLSPDGFLSARLYYLMLPLLLGILAIGLGSSLIASEENSGTIELLLARPLSRSKLLLAKALAGILNLAAIALVALITTIIVCHLVKLNEPIARLALATLATAVLGLLFGAVAFSVTTLGRARAAAVGLSVLVALSGYIIASLESTVAWLRWPAKALPYHYYRPTEILQGHFSWYNIGGLLGAALVLGIISWSAFRKRDLNSL